MPDSGIRQFGKWIIGEDWDCVDSNCDPSVQALALDNLLEFKMDAIFPTKTVRLSNKDKKWIDSDLKKLDRLKKREYSKKGKTAKYYYDLSETFEMKYKKAAEDYLNKNVRDLKEADPGKAYATLKRMGA